MKKILFFIVVIICLLAANNLLGSIYTTWQKQAFLTEAERDVAQEEQRHQALQKQLKMVSQQEFVEEQAREKLLLVKPGEQLVLIPTGLIVPTPKPQGVGVTQPHWQEWLEYFEN